MNKGGDGCIDVHGGLLRHPPHTDTEKGTAARPVTNVHRGCVVPIECLWDISSRVWRG
jgi:hypothetical protein